MTDATDAGRRRALAGLLAGGVLAAAPWLSAFTFERGRRPRVAIVGGGYAGASCARWLRRLDPELRITLIEPRRSFHTGFYCNAAAVGLLPFDAIRQDVSGLQQHGIEVIADRVIGFAPERRRLCLASGRRIEAEAVVVGCGIRMRADAVAGYDAAAMARNPPAWPGALRDLQFLRNRLHALPDKPHVVVSVPGAPYRCPPGPYERVSLFAHWLQQNRPGARITICDAKDAFSKDALFFEAWARHYPGMIEWRGRQDGGEVVHYEAQRVQLASAERLRADWVHLIPPQAAGALARDSGLAGSDGWIPVRHQDFSVPGAPGVYAIGDAAQAQPMPKSAFAAVNQGRHVAQAIIAHFCGEAMAPAWLANTCYSLVTPEHGFSVSSLYRVEEDALRVSNGSTQLSPLGAGPGQRLTEARQARALYQTMAAALWGR